MRLSKLEELEGNIKLDGKYLFLLSFLLSLFQTHSLVLLDQLIQFNPMSK